MDRISTPCSLHSSPRHVLTDLATDSFDFTEMSSVLSNGAGAHDGASGATSTRWGFQVRPDEQRIRCMKLFLDPNQPMPSFLSISDIKAQLATSGKDIKGVVADYLSAVFAHTNEILIRRYGPLFVQTTPLKIILTVPAVWSDAAKDATMKAAVEAGMGNDLNMISEPEAAAVYALQAIQPDHLAAGDNFVVADAGGGTVDLISYEIKQLTPLRIEESVPGSGGCCGAAFLNVRFEEFVRGKFGRKAFAAICEKKPKSWLSAMKYFEDYVKRNFDPAERTEFNFPFPGVADNAAAGLEQGFLTVTSPEIGSIFKPIIEEVIKLVDGQISQLRSAGKSISALILVGGFGQSECLLNCFRLRFGSMPGVDFSSKFGLAASTSQIQRGLDIMQPANAWTAVVRGAVLRGLEEAELVLSRKSRRFYGVTCSQEFDSSIHSEESKYWDSLAGKFKAFNRMKWFISKGETVSATEPVQLGFSHNFRQNAAKAVTVKLITCDEENAPLDFDSSPGSSTKVLCKMVVNIESVPGNLWKERVNSSGTRYLKLSHDIGMQIESGKLRSDFRVDGVVYGKVMATFD